MRPISLRRPFQTSAAVVFALLLATPVLAQRETETVERTLKLQPGGTLQLKTFSGRVRITGGAGDEVVIKAIRRAERDRLDDIRLEITQSGNTVEIEANHRLVKRRNENVVETDFDIQVPARTRLDITTFSAPVTILGVTESQHVEGFSSDVRIESPQWADGRSIDVSTFSGNVTLRLPESARGAVDFSSFSGRFESDLPVTLVNTNRRNVRGTLNGGGAADLRLKTFSGSVSLLR
jgi:hypothetical protein